MRTKRSEACVPIIFISRQFVAFIIGFTRAIARRHLGVVDADEEFEMVHHTDEKRKPEDEREAVIRARTYLEANGIRKQPKDPEMDLFDDRFRNNEPWLRDILF